jgi:TonB family protein
MKATDLMLAFALSAALHAAAFTSNLINVNAEDAVESGVRTVRLSIVPSAVQMNESILPEVAEEKSAPAEPANKRIQNAVRYLPDDSPETKAPAVISEERNMPPPDIQPVEAPVHQKEIFIADVLPHSREAIQDKAPPGAPKTGLIESDKARQYDSGRVLSGISVYGGEVAGPALSSHASLPPHASNRKNVESPDKEETSPARITGLSKPAYPRYCRIHGEEGSTILSVEIHADGNLGNIEIVRSSGYRRLEKAGFIPAFKDGRAVTSKKHIAFRFSLKDRED